MEKYLEKKSKSHRPTSYFYTCTLKACFARRTPIWHASNHPPYPTFSSQTNTAKLIFHHIY
ncbi:hypothetical protein HMPREF1991_02572 [Hoylesella loescheii DSM 19665 = JCM 12249 = ATCC 15930]|uniref:Uncharacterized protein n=1 Tax=Hoylesella loescheii DSM 19665 = JCM 12249 = ATCC 15930 TaxID=1122985 RepID=A0A069QF87_HOYLO|nr:hypothetical protein HMPREF1991_02572 [Hoylesella loescheii DSM 19665 = JCM 12249 = ATCC 15930]